VSLDEKGLSIVSIGGGTGLSTLLSGLKHFVSSEARRIKSAENPRVESLTAVVTVTDDGGSSGRLRKEFQILPPGDIRNCMVALAEDERLLTRLFQYRFASDGELSGHSFGNIFLAALAGVTGDFVEAIKVTSEVLAIKGRIYPSTTEDVTLVAELEDGRVVKGETRISESRSRVKKLWLSHEDCRPVQATLEAIAKADMITIGPGSLYTSIVPNLLVHGVADAIRDSRALKVYIANIMTQPGETDGFDLDDHVRVLREHSPDLKLDYVVVNTTKISAALREKYLAEGAVQVTLKRSKRAKNDADDYRLIIGDLLNQNAVVRHDPIKLAELLLSIYNTKLADLDESAARTTAPAQS